MHSSNDLLSTYVSALSIHLTCQVLASMFYIFTYYVKYLRECFMYSTNSNDVSSTSECFMYSTNSNDVSSTYVSVLCIQLIVMMCQVLM